MAKKSAVKNEPSAASVIDRLNQLQTEGRSLNSINRLPERSVRKAYTQLRDKAQKRLKRLESSEYANNRSVQRLLERYPQGFEKLANISDRRSLTYELSEINKFLNNQYLNIKGLNAIRDKSIATLKANGFTGINKQNYSQFTKFMDYVHDKFSESMVPSDFIVSKFFSAKVKPGSKDLNTLKSEFDKWIKDQPGYVEPKKEKKPKRKKKKK